MLEYLQPTIQSSSRQYTSTGASPPYPAYRRAYEPPRVVRFASITSSAALVLSVASFRRVTMPRRSRAAHPAIATTTSPSSFPASPPIPIEHPVGAAPQRPRSGKDRNLVAARNRTASPSVP